MTDLGGGLPDEGVRSYIIRSSSEYLCCEISLEQGRSLDQVCMGLWHPEARVDRLNTSSNIRRVFDHNQRSVFELGTFDHIPMDFEKESILAPIRLGFGKPFSDEIRKFRIFLVQQKSGWMKVEESDVIVLQF